MVVLVASAKVRTSRWVHNEISLAEEKGIPIIPVLAEPMSLPLWMRHLQALDFSARVDWAVLLAAVRKKIPPVPPFSKGGTQPVWACQEGNDEFGRYADLAVAGVTQRMRWIGPGTFLMGSPQDEAGRGANELQHEVTLTRRFWLADTACTQALWQAVMGGNPSHFKGAELPVEYVDWYKAQKFLHKLGEQIAGLNARLSTEAEWEYACRAGTTTAFAFGESMTAQQVQVDGKQTVAVKSLPANPWGLYAMHGNVWEWCQDGYGEYPAGRWLIRSGMMAVICGCCVAVRGGMAANRRGQRRGGVALRATVITTWVFVSPQAE